MNSRRIEFFGVPVDALSMEETVAKIQESILQRKLCQHGVVNIAKLVKLQEDRALRESVLNCDIVSADGVGVVWGARLLGMHLPERVSGIDLMQRLIRVAAEKGYRPFFLGARPSVVQSVVERYRCIEPRLQIAGFHHGFFSGEEESQVVEKVRQSRADILFVAMSSPKKEIFIHKHMKELGVPFCMGVGGSFDVLAGEIRRAPYWMQKYGLEWLHRLIQEPRRMFWRYVRTNWIFAWMLTRTLIFGNYKSKPL